MAQTQRGLFFGCSDRREVLNFAVMLGSWLVLMWRKGARVLCSDCLSDEFRGSR
jgi:hypothetical protein